MSDNLQAVIDTALAGAEPHEVDVDELYTIVVPNGSVAVTLDLEKYADRPRRKKGETVLFTPASLCGYIADHNPAGDTRVYADVETATVVAVLNDDTGLEVGWRDHRATLRLRATPAWTRWAALNGKLVDQTAFAEHIETSLNDVVDPPGATLLEMAKTFEAKTGVEFKSAVILESGQRQLEYVETIAAKAGQGGKIDVPKTLGLQLAPWEGAPHYKVTARLRFRVHGGALTLGYVLDRPEEVLRDAFDKIVADIETAVSLTAYRGRPAEAR